MIRWLKFNAVGVMGSVVQLATLGVMVRMGANYLAATAAAVELAILHNYAWHTRWTWKERDSAGLDSLWRFHLGNGCLSMASNLALMKVFTGWLGWPVLPANFLAILLTSFVNFFVGDRWVFRQLPERGSSSL